MAEGDTSVAEKPAEKPEPSEKPEPTQQPSLGEIISGQMTAVSRGLGDVTTAKIEADRPIYEGMQRQLDEDQARIRRQYDATRASAEKLQPWDYERQRERFTTDPLQAFGSVGSVFGIIASAFTHAPMENALNASAAAMNAIRNGDAFEYERANRAWKENMDLAVKRHGMEREAYQDAITLMKTDMVVGEAKLKMNAAQFQDNKILMLLDAGLSDEVFKLFDSRNRAMDSTMDAYTKSRDMGLENAMIEHLTPTKEQEPDPTKRIAANINAVQTAHNLTNTKDPRWGEYATWQLEELSNTQKLPDAAARQKKLDDLGLTHKYGVGRAGGDPNLTLDRQLAQDVARYREQLNADPSLSQEDKDQMIDDYVRRRKAVRTPLTPSKADELKSLYDRHTLASQTIDKVEALLVKHKALTGLGGRITRPAEVVSNWFGSNETDRAQFASYIKELQEWGRALINDRARGRGLSAEEERITGIVPGLSAGDTTINTAKRLLELQKLFRTMQGQLQKRLEGTWKPDRKLSPPGEEGVEGAPAKPAPWEAAPVVE